MLTAQACIALFARILTPLEHVPGLQVNMAATMAAGSMAATRAVTRSGAANALRVAPLRASRAARAALAVQAAAVKLEYPTKVFPKELVE